MTKLKISERRTDKKKGIVLFIKVNETHLRTIQKLGVEGRGEINFPINLPS